MLKIIGLSQLVSKPFRANDNDRVNESIVDKIIKRFKKLRNAKSKNQIYIKTTRKPAFFTFIAKKAFN